LISRSGSSSNSATRTAIGSTWGLYRAADFSRCENRTYVCSTDGSPLFLRALAQAADVIRVLDGGGEEHEYRVVPFPSDRYREMQP